MKEFLEAIHGQFSIAIMKKDGTFSDEFINYRTYDENTKRLKAIRQKIELAERTDLAIESIASETEYYTIGKEHKECHYLLICLKEI